jgi:hypothetical protein
VGGGRPLRGGCFLSFSPVEPVVIAAQPVTQIRLLTAQGHRAPALIGRIRFLPRRKPGLEAKGTVPGLMEPQQAVVAAAKTSTDRPPCTRNCTAPDQASVGFCPGADLLTRRRILCREDFHCQTRAPPGLPTHRAKSFFFELRSALLDGAAGDRAAFAFRVTVEEPVVPVPFAKPPGGVYPLFQPSQPSFVVNG